MADVSLCTAHIFRVSITSQPPAVEVTCLEPRGSAANLFTMKQDYPKIATLLYNSPNSGSSKYAQIGWPGVSGHQVHPKGRSPPPSARISQDQWILETVSGQRLELVATPTHESVSGSPVMDPAKAALLSEEVQGLISCIYA